MSGPVITVARKEGWREYAKRVTAITKGGLAAYVGVPSSTSKDRSDQLLGMASIKRTKKGKLTKKGRYLQKAAEQDITNAETLFLLSKGSPIRNQPPRPVLEPAVQADGNRQAIAHEIAESVKANLQGNKPEAVKRMKRAAMAGQTAARKWFTDPRNNWAPNAPSTIARKGSDRPGIDTGATRSAIVGIVGEQ